MATTNTRHKFTVEFEAREGTTPAESLEWIQKFFEFFHPGMKAKVLGKPEIIKPDEPEGMDLI